MDSARVLGGARAELLVRELRSGSKESGLDLVQPLRVGWYNREVDASLRLEDFGSEENLAIVIGNTRALWPRFLQRFQADALLRAAPNPLERYVEEQVGSAVSRLGVAARLRWSHDTGERRVAVQRLAHVAGLAYLSESHLSVHAKYGPWIALRAAVSFDVPAGALPRSQLEHPCGSCAARCRPALERALVATGDATDAAAVRAHYRLWLAVRDACPAGRAHRYDHAQIHYHYLADREQLLAAAGIPSEPKRTYS